jgi:hypothetical protein
MDLEAVALRLRRPPPLRVERVAAWLRAVRAEAAGVDARGLALVVLSPLGLAERDRLTLGLGALDVRVRDRLALPSWSRVATAIRVEAPDASPGRLQMAALFEEAWEAIAPGGAGEAWAISAADHAVVARAKRAIREPMRSVQVDFGLPGLPPRLLTPFHVADAGGAEPEARRILAAVELLAPGAPRRRSGTAA